MRTDAELLKIVERVFEGLEQSLREQFALSVLLENRGVAPDDIEKQMEEILKHPEIQKAVNAILAPCQVMKVTMFQALKQRGGGGDTPPSSQKSN